MSFSKTSNVKVMDSKSKSQLELDILSFLQTLAYQHRLKNFDPNLLLSLVCVLSLEGSVEFD